MDPMDTAGAASVLGTQAVLLRLQLCLCKTLMSPAQWGGGQCCLPAHVVQGRMRALTPAKVAFVLGDLAKVICVAFQCTKRTRKEDGGKHFSRMYWRRVNCFTQRKGQFRLDIKM